MKNKHHGTTRYFIEGEGFIEETALKNINFSFKRAEVENLAKNEQDTDENRAFRFMRMLNLPHFSPSRESLQELGLIMEENPLLIDHPELPAGFTYFGQFLDHDVTRDQTKGLPDSVLTPEEIIQGRSPSLDLDSLYGRGPILSPELYEEDKVKLKIGITTPSLFGNVNQAFPNDLPRDVNKNAIIGDSRNDENLAVAQTHLAFLKFHNKVADKLASENGLSGNALFNKAKEEVVKHYQWIVLNDFLPLISDRAVLSDILNNGPKFFKVKENEIPAMPIEFSVAAYRLGHSMIRDDYEWNRVFESNGDGPLSTLRLLFQFTGLSGNLGGEPTLPSNWIIDWTRFFDFTKFNGINNNPKFNNARLIDTALANHLKNVPGFPPGPESSLSVRNLIRGKIVGLPTGQSVADLFNVIKLTEEQIASGNHKDVILKNGFETQTPLWYYILKESEVLNNGMNLGPVGSRILNETFIGLIKGSRISILKDSDWKPTLSIRNVNEFSMSDLLAFVDDLNPIGDKQIT
jgi:hypothetical protein